MTDTEKLPIEETNEYFKFEEEYLNSSNFWRDELLTQLDNQAPETD